jgi:hypothetical protein
MHEKSYIKNVTALQAEKNIYVMVHHASELFSLSQVHAEENACFWYSLSQNYINI